MSTTQAQAPIEAGSPSPGHSRTASEIPANRNAPLHGTDNPEPMALTCLIVDDNPHFLESARALLERGGITVVGVASNIAEAVRRADELQPDFALLDIDIGGESGFDLARRLELETNLKPAKMIMVSAYAEEDFADLITATRAAGFVSKSILSARAIREVLGRRDDAAPETS
jgi:DNA-binding NarL/FixJ family response regulator